jgi:small GTP-binding protein
VRLLAERLRGDGLKVWFDEWELRPGDSVPAKIEDGLERSRVLVLCMSANAFGSDWAQLESGTFRFRDPLNKERRFIPLRLDDAEIKGSLAQFLFIDWRPAERELEYGKLVEACRPALYKMKRVNKKDLIFQLHCHSLIKTYVFSPDGSRAITGSLDNKVRLWDLKQKKCLRVFEGHSGQIWSLAWSSDQLSVLSASHDGTVRLWNIETGRCLSTFQGHIGKVWCVAWSPDNSHIISGGDDGTIRIWNVEKNQCQRVLAGHTEVVFCVRWCTDQNLILSGSQDMSLRLWNVETGNCLHVFRGHTNTVRDVAWSKDQQQFLSASWDRTLRLWDAKTGRCLRVFEGHTDEIKSVSWNADQRFALSASWDDTVRLWEVETGRCLRVFTGHSNALRSVAWSADGRSSFSGDDSGGIRIWDLSEFVGETRKPKLSVPASPVAPEQVQYTNAKVLLVGESGAGKTGLSKRLASNTWEPSDSTIGAWATQWKLPVPSGQGVEREIWLWDFGGQADQRLIHQLYMDETALAVLVFDGQKEELFETLGQWDRDLIRATRNPFAKLLVAGRVDAGGLRVSRSEVDKFASERKFRGFLETSAKQNLGCEELKRSILESINWDEIPCRTTEVLFKRLKEEIIRLKDEGRVLMRFNELRETLQLRLSGEFRQIRDEQLRAVLTLLSGPGVLWALTFGSWVLLQPERINAYGQAVIRTLQADEHQRGCLMEERVLKGDLRYESSMERLTGDDERFVLLAMHQTLVERGLCLRLPTDHGNMLVFPCYYRRERPDIVKHPAVLVNYEFTGFLDEIYATLIVRLHHTLSFQQDHLWRYAADFKTNTGKQLGVKLTRQAPGVGELEVFFDPSVTIEEKIIFSKYVHEHLLKHAIEVKRLRHYLCPHCGTAVENRDVAMKRLGEWLDGTVADLSTGARRVVQGKKEPPTIICVDCENRVPLWDDLEQCFASPKIQRRIHDMQEEASVVLSNQSKERVLVGEVISTVALANQICREFSVSDQGIDMEIEFTNDAHEATNRKLYLQLKSGDSYLRERKSDGAEIFTIKDERWASYWMASAFPVLLVIRNADGEVRWMRIDDYLKRESKNGAEPVKHIIFDGERFDVMSVRRWRERVIGERGL